MDAVFISTSKVEPGTGGGNVSYHEYNALSKVADKVTLLDGSIVSLNSCSPFLSDYVAASKLSELKDVDLLFINGNPFGLTVKVARRKSPGCKVIVDVPAHNVEESVKEFSARLGEYPFKHMTDPILWSRYTEHIRVADAIIFPSKYSMKYLVGKLKLEEGRCHVIPHGCNPPAEVKPFPEVFTVGHLGVNGPDKGQIYLYRAWAFSGLGELKIAGQGTEVWAPHGLGYIRDTGLFYDSISVYVQPSVTEGFGIPVLEAMSHGRPVIVTEGVGAKDLVSDGVEGFIVPIRDPKAIAEKLKMLHGDRSLLNKMGLKAREKAVEYTWDTVERMYQTLIRSVMG